MANEILNDKLFYQSYEIIGGEKIMSPAANLDHSGIIMRLGMIIGTHLSNTKSGYVYPDNVDVHFSDGSLYKPDLVIVLKSNEKILAGRKNIYGAPDMVVEVLSYSTRKKDLTVKKDTYEAQGVREYWIIDPRAKSVSVYLLRDGKYFLDDTYILLNEEDLKLLDDEEKADVKYEVPVSILEGLSIPLEFIFSWGY
ncbi:MAG: Uma2 family endonuclease [Selenomonadaceae bacterium]|nr:Uma2 family endonuclease [Selenomonadaceae bacterium]